MDVRINADPEELEQKAQDLVKSLAHQLADYDPDLLDVVAHLCKSSLDDQVSMRYPVMRELHAKARRIYKDQMDRMLEEIERILEE